MPSAKLEKGVIWIVLRHKISNIYLEMDPVKIDVVSKLPLPSNIKLLQSFLRRVGFYRRFIKGFSQIAKSLSNLLIANQSYIFNEKCNQTFQTQKDALILAPIGCWCLSVCVKCDYLIHSNSVCEVCEVYLLV